MTMIYRLANLIESEIRSRKTGGVSSGLLDGTSRSTSVPSRIGKTTWTGAPPDGSAPLFQRVAYALNVNEDGLADMFGLPVEDVKRYWKLKTKSHLPAMDQDELWSDIYDHVCRHIALSMALREELQRKLAEDRKRRLARRAAIKDR